MELARAQGTTGVAGARRPVPWPRACSPACMHAPSSQALSPRAPAGFWPKHPTCCAAHSHTHTRARCARLPLARSPPAPRHAGHAARQYPLRFSCPSAPPHFSTVEAVAAACAARLRARACLGPFNCSSLEAWMFLHSSLWGATPRCPLPGRGACASALGRRRRAAALLAHPPVSSSSLVFASAMPLPA